MVKPKNEVLGVNHRVAPPPFFLNKPSIDDVEVIDNFDIGFDDDDLEAILDGFVRLIYVILAKFWVPSQVEKLDEDFFEEEKGLQVKEPRQNITMEAFDQPTEEMKRHL